MKHYNLLKKWIIKCLILTVFFMSPLILFPQDQVQYKRVYLSGSDAAKTVDWDFKVTDGRNSGEWSTIPVPSNWELQGFGTYNYGHDHRDKEKKLGKEHGLYRHKFNVPKEWKDKVINIVFDGSMTDTKVYINGKLAGDIHQGAFYSFKYDISKLLKYGKENLLEVDVAKHSSNESVNRAERQADFWIFGGIFRPVYLEVLPQQHFKRIAIDAKANGSFTAHIFLTPAKQNTSVKVEVFSIADKQLGQALTTSLNQRADSVTVSGHFQNVIPWSPELPELYKVRFTLLENGQPIYQKEETIGFRTVELIENDGFYINGQRVVFKGVNRHSFWPETGRALSEENHLLDIQLMKEMNMNAVRMSHYPPDERFLDLCDSLGLFVLDEVTGWQDSYDTIVGPKVIREMILKDENHPSILVWDHGNEGGWDFANEKWFHTYDFQKRPVIYPWLQRNGVDTRHYPTFNYGINRLAKGQDVFMPTELLHGLYDGGHGAGLEDFWNSYSSSPLSAGGFLWSFADEAVVRTDKGNKLDSDGNHAPDGIVGPHREKEASFYTIKKIWSPVQVMPVTINKFFDGKIFLQNKYIYTNLNKCNFSWTLSSVKGFSDAEVISSGKLQGPDIAPGEIRAISIDLPENFADAELFTLTAYDRFDREIYTWSWAVKNPSEVAEELINKINKDPDAITVKAEGKSVEVLVRDLKFIFDKENGFLEEVHNSEGMVSFNGGPLPVGAEAKPRQTNWSKDARGNFILRVDYEGYPSYLKWTVAKEGLVHLEAGPLLHGIKDIDFIGVSFNYPESLVTGVQWMGKGPYRVWKNRMKGVEQGVWQKEYNNTATGSSYDNLIYPEFKGYHSGLYWMELQTKETPIRIISETPGLFFRLYTPAAPGDPVERVIPSFPAGDISFLYEIPAIGTKFKNAEELGPASQKGEIGSHKGDQSYPISLWFDFNVK